MDQNNQTPLPLSQPAPVFTKPSHFLCFLFIGLALILLGILIGVLAARFLIISQLVVPLVTPTPTPTSGTYSNWKTYTSSKPAYSFKYPPEFFLKTSNSTGDKSQLSFCSPFG